MPEDDPGYAGRMLWESLSEFEREAMFLGMHSYMEVADPTWLLTLEAIVVLR